MTEPKKLSEDQATLMGKFGAEINQLLGSAKYKRLPNVAKGQALLGTAAFYLALGSMLEDPEGCTEEVITKSLVEDFRHVRERIMQSLTEKLAEKPKH